MSHESVSNRPVCHLFSCRQPYALRSGKTVRSDLSLRRPHYPDCLA